MSEQAPNGEAEAEAKETKGEKKKKSICGSHCIAKNIFGVSIY